MRFGLIAMVLLMLSLVAGCKGPLLWINSSTIEVNLYEYKGRNWLLIRETGLSATNDVEYITTLTRLAIVRPDGTAQITASRKVFDDGDVSNTIYPEARKLLGSDPISTIDNSGRLIRRIPRSAIKVTRKKGSRNTDIQIEPSFLQGKPVEDQSEPISDTPAGFENVTATTPDAEPLARAEKDGGD